MTVNKVGYNYRHTGDFCVNRPHGSGDMDMVMATSPAIFLLNGENVTVEENTIVIFRGDTPQFYRGVDNFFSNNWFHFTPDSEDIFDKLGIPLDTPISGITTTALSEIVLKMSNEMNGGRAYCQEILASYFNIFMHTLSRLIHSTDNSEASSLIDIRNAIYNMPYKRWDVDMLANQAGYSRSYLSHKYKADFGVSPMQDVVESKMEYAKYLLESTDYRVNEISDMCGYDRTVYFIYTFKSKMNCTPTEYRKKFR